MGDFFILLIFAAMGLIVLGPAITVVCLILFWHPIEPPSRREVRGFGVIMDRPHSDADAVRSTQGCGDQKQKPDAFPDPAKVGAEINGIRFLRLENLIEPKLASGMTNPGRLKDLADVQEIVKTLKLPRGFSEQVHEYVRPKFLEMWDAVQGSDPQE
jgi:hypothetical protein